MRGKGNEPEVEDGREHDEEEEGRELEDNDDGGSVRTNEGGNGAVDATEDGEGEGDAGVDDLLDELVGLVADDVNELGDAHNGEDPIKDGGDDRLDELADGLRVLVGRAWENHRANVEARSSHVCAEVGAALPGWEGVGDGGILARRVSEGISSNGQCVRETEGGLGETGLDGNGLLNGNAESDGVGKGRGIVPIDADAAGNDLADVRSVGALDDSKGVGRALKEDLEEVEKKTTMPATRTSELSLLPRSNLN